MAEVSGMDLGIARKVVGWSTLRKRGKPIVEEMDAFGRRVGWKPTYIGDSNHPRNQKMMRFQAT
jgi:hypothetical protein